jgi:hypothetical protein
VMRSTLARALVVLLVAEAMPAAEPVAVRTDWKGFQEQVAQRKLKNRRVWISVNSGGEIKATFLRVAENGLVVMPNGATKQWSPGKAEATVPRDVIGMVRFGGKVGRRGLIGGLVGLGVGAAITGATAASMGGGECEGGACGAVAIVIPLFAVAGYLIGHALDKPAPFFVLER